MDRIIGPNYKRVLIRFMSTKSVPPGGGFAEAIETITTPGKLTVIAKQSMIELDRFIAQVRSAPDNPFGDDEEAICAAFLAALEKQERESSQPRPV